MYEYGDETSVCWIDMSTSMDLRLESLELEINLVIGVSKIMIETWHAVNFLHGLLEVLGSVMFTKFCVVKFFTTDLGRVELIMYWFSS